MKEYHLFVAYDMKNPYGEMAKLKEKSRKLGNFDLNKPVMFTNIEEVWPDGKFRYLKCTAYQGGE
jgi:hypothetical protein